MSMIRTSVSLPRRTIKGLEQLVRDGHYPSVSEALRDAARQVVDRHLVGAEA